MEWRAGGAAGGLQGLCGVDGWDKSGKEKGEMELLMIVRRLVCV